MPNNVVPLRPAFDPARVGLSSSGTQHRTPFYVVDIVEEHGGRACMGQNGSHIPIDKDGHQTHDANGENITIKSSGGSISLNGQVKING